MIDRQRLIDSFVAMVGIDSMSRQEKAMSEYLQVEFARRGFTAAVDDAAAKTGSNTGNLLLVRTGETPSQALFFSAHMDTVVNGAGIKVVFDQGKIRSDGTTILGSDDKAGIAALLEAIDFCLENGLSMPTLEIVVTVCEEQGLLGAKSFDFSQLVSRYGYVLDGGDDPGCIVVQSPCQYSVEYKVRGKSAHAGIEPENGINAIHVMAKALAKMDSGRIDSETTCNFGTIAGGNARNIVPDLCRVDGEARSLDRKKLDSLMERLSYTFLKTVDDFGGEGEVHMELLYQEYKLASDDRVVSIASTAASRAGLEPRLVKTGGGSDASIINGSGITCANLGIGMRNAHTVDEYIMIDDMEAVARWIVEIIRLAAEGPDQA